MAIVDFILNIFGLLLWLNWRSSSFDPLVKTSPISLAGALKRTEPPSLHGLNSLITLGGFLLFRAFIYWKIGSSINWVPNLPLGAISLFFRPDLFGRALLFSLLSFLLTLAISHSWLLLLSLVNRHTADENAFQRMVRLQLGFLDRLPWLIKLILPLAVAGLVWLLLSPLLAYYRIIQAPASWLHGLEQGTVLGLRLYLTWKYLIGAVLLLWLVSAYVYLGDNAFWNFVTITGRNLLEPLRWAPLQLGKIDFRPVVVIALVFVLAPFAERGLTRLFSRLPL